MPSSDSLAVALASFSSEDIAELSPSVQTGLGYLLDGAAEVVAGAPAKAAWSTAAAGFNAAATAAGMAAMVPFVGALASILVPALSGDSQAKGVGFTLEEAQQSCANGYQHPPLEPFGFSPLSPSDLFAWWITPEQTAALEEGDTTHGADMPWAGTVLTLATESSVLSDGPPWGHVAVGLPAKRQKLYAALRRKIQEAHPANALKKGPNASASFPLYALYLDLLRADIDAGRLDADMVAMLATASGTMQSPRHPIGNRWGTAKGVSWPQVLSMSAVHNGPTSSKHAASIRDAVEIAGALAIPCEAILPESAASVVTDAVKRWKQANAYASPPSGLVATLAPTHAEPNKILAAVKKLQVAVKANQSKRQAVAVAAGGISLLGAAWYAPALARWVARW